MEISYRPIGDDWVWEKTKNRQYSRFDTPWTTTIAQLKKELRMLQAKLVVIQIDLEERDFRIDGEIRANAKDPVFPGVILAFEMPDVGALKYRCDMFHGTYRGPSWQQNVRAIALGLEALRKVERYGIASRKEQYTGWKALGSGIAMPQHQMSKEDAAQFLWKESAGAFQEERIATDPEYARLAYRFVAKRLHPDAGGDDDEFVKATEALRVLVS